MGRIFLGDAGHRHLPRDGRYATNHSFRADGTNPRIVAELVWQILERDMPYLDSSVNRRIELVATSESIYLRPVTLKLDIALLAPGRRYI